MLRQLIALRSSVQNGPASDFQETMPFESPLAPGNLLLQSGVATPVDVENRGVIRRSLVKDFNSTDSQG